MANRRGYQPELISPRQTEMKQRWIDFFRREPLNRSTPPAGKKKATHSSNPTRDLFELLGRLFVGPGPQEEAPTGPSIGPMTGAQRFIPVGLRREMQEENRPAGIFNKIAQNFTVGDIDNTPLFGGKAALEGLTTLAKDKLGFKTVHEVLSSPMNFDDDFIQTLVQPLQGMKSVDDLVKTKEVVDKWIAGDLYSYQADEAFSKLGLPGGQVDLMADLITYFYGPKSGKFQQAAENWTAKMAAVKATQQQTQKTLEFPPANTPKTTNPQAQVPFTDVVAQSIAKGISESTSPTIASNFVKQLIDFLKPIKPKTASDIMNAPSPNPSDIFQFVNTHATGGAFPIEKLPELIKKTYAQDAEEFDLVLNWATGYGAKDWGIPLVDIEPPVRAPDPTPPMKNILFRDAAYAIQEPQTQTNWPGIEESARQFRALKQGFTIPAYHATGTEQLFEDVETFRPASHFGTHLAALDRLRSIVGGGGFSLDEPLYGRKLRTFPVLLKEGKYITTTDSGAQTPQDWLTALEREGIISREEADALFSDRWRSDFAIRLNEITEPRGVLGIQYRNEVEDPGSFSYVVFDPKNIRSPFANFDWNKVNFRDLLAGLGGVGVGIGAASRQKESK